MADVEAMLRQERRDSDYLVKQARDEGYNDGYAQGVQDCIAALKRAEDSNGRVYDDRENWFRTASAFLKSRFPRVIENCTSPSGDK